MKKNISLTLLIICLFLTGCTGYKKTENLSKTQERIHETNNFNHELFSLNLPTPYITQENIIQPKNEKDFPQIGFGISKEQVDPQKLLEKERALVDIRCGQTDACGKIISNEPITIGGKSGMKFTIQYERRDMKDESEYLNEYHYSFANGEYIFRFWTLASDLENIEETSNLFDTIIETISFK